MSTIAEFGRIGTGILHPMMSHQFRLSVTRLGATTFTNQVRCADIDLLHKSIRVEVEQPLVDQGLFDEIIDLCKPHCAPIVYVDHLAGDGNTVCRLEFRHCAVQDHSYRLDYAVNGVATHIITFTFTQVVFVGRDKLPRQ